MSADKLIVIISGLSLIGLIYWFFFGKKNEISSEGSSIDVVVDGGYKPSILKIKKDTETKITFLRTDSNSCLEEVVFPDFRIKKYLPLNEKVEVTLVPKQQGEFDFHCGMNMFHGKVVVG